MTVPVQTPSIEYVENGATVTFPVPFRYRDPQHLKAERIAADGAVTELPYGTGFTATAGDTAAGGTLTTAAPGTAGLVLRIKRETPRAQDTDYIENGAFPSESHESTMDEQAMVNQEQDVEIAEIRARALLVPEGQDGLVMDLAGLLDGDLLQFRDGMLKRLDRSLFAGKYYAGDATGKLVPATGTGIDAGLRGDLALPTGATLIGSAGGGTVQGDLNASGVISRLSKTATAAANRTTLNAELAALNAAGGGILLIPFGTYPMTGEIVLQSNVIVAARGVTFQGSGIYLYAAPGVNVTNWWIDGLTIDTDVAANFGFRLFDVSFFRMTGMRILRAGSPGYVGLLYGASFGIIYDFKSTGSNGIWIEGHDLIFDDGEMTAGTGGDDCLVLKAPYVSVSEPRSSTYNITIANWISNGHTGTVSIGSEIGYFGVNDPTFARRISNVTISNIVARNAQYAVFIKPGANAGNDYRDGTVEGVTITNATVEDPAGAKFAVGLLMWAGRGGVIRNVEVKNLIVRARALNQATINAGIKMQVFDYAGGSRPSRIADISIDGYQIIDPWEGVANGVGGAPGHPIDNGVAIEKVTGNGGTVGEFGSITLMNGLIDGTRRSGIEIGPNLNDQVEIDGIEIRNARRGAVAATDGGIVSQSRVRLRNVRGIQVSSGLKIGHSTQTAKNYVGERMSILLGSAGAGNMHKLGFFRALVESYVTNIALVDAGGIAQSDVDYTSFEFRNMASGNVFASCNSRVTGGRNFVVDTAVDVTADLILGADAYLAKDAVVRFAKSDTGAGRAITNLVAHIDYVPIGRA